MGRLALAVLAALTMLRLAIAAGAPLAPDEAYYWVWSRALAAGYPDHPPMVALWIRLGTMLAGDTALGIRLLGPVSVAVASLLLVAAGERLLPGRGTGLRAAALLNATLLYGVGGVLMTPDAPLLAFWIACLWALARLVRGGDPRWWLAVGLFAGLAMASKYTALLLWVGIALWLLATPSARPWLRRREPWLGALLGLLVFLQVLRWEAAHGWVSLARQGGRIGEWHPAQAARFLSELIGGQIGLVTPLVFVLFAAGVVEALRQAWRMRDPAWSLLAALTLPGAALFIQHALGDRVQGNWPAVIYPAAAVAAGALPAPWQRLAAPAVGLGFAVTLLIYVQAVFPLPVLPAGLDPIARQIAGWDRFAAEVDAARRQAGAGFVAADQYGVAAELARALPPGVTVIGAEERWSGVDLPVRRLAGQVGILVHSARRAGAPDSMAWPGAVEFASIARQRGADPVEAFLLYRVVVPDDAPAAKVLPRPD